MESESESMMPQHRVYTCTEAPGARIASWSEKLRCLGTGTSARAIWIHVYTFTPPLKRMGAETGALTTCRALRSSPE